MSHGGGGGFGHGGQHGGHHGVHSGHGGEPQSSASWNMAYAGSKPRKAGLELPVFPWPVWVGLLAFVVMLLPFVLDWDEPHLQRLLIGHDLTAKEIAHNNAVDQAMAGQMRDQVKKAFGAEIGGQMLPAPPMSGSSLIAEPPAPSSIPDDDQSSSSAADLGKFNLSGLGQAAGQPSLQQAEPPVQQMQPQAAPMQNYTQSYTPQSLQANPYGGQQYAAPPAASSYMSAEPTYSPAYSAAGARSGAAGSLRAVDRDYRSARHRVVVDR